MATERWFLTYRTLGTLTPPATVLVVGDFESSDGFAISVRRGVERRARLSMPNKVSDILTESLNLSKRSNSQFVQGFLDVIARRRLVAIICATRSDTTPAVIKMARTFRIPILLVVATAESVVADTYYYVLRLVPNDEQQSITLANWASTFTRVLIVADETDYGQSLADRISSELSTYSVSLLRSGLVRTSNLYQLLGAYKDWSPDALIFTGYSRDVPALLRTLDALDKHVPVALSDGCYSRNLPQLSSSYSGKITLSFPVNPFPSGYDDIAGFGVLGADAATAVRYGLLDESLRGTSRASFPDSLRSILSPGALEEDALQGCYSFNKSDGTISSENLVGKFMLIEPAANALLEARTVCPTLDNVAKHTP